MKKFFCNRKFNIVYSLAAILLAWIVWLIASLAVKNEYLVPSVGQSLSEFFVLFIKGFFWRAVGMTLLRTLIAAVISFSVALGCACIAIIFKPFAAFMRPIVAIFRTLPTMAVLLLILVWLSPATAPVAVTILVLFPASYSQLTAQIGGVDEKLLQMAKVYSFTLKKRLMYIYLPAVLPQTVKDFGGNISFGLKITVSAEVMASTYTALGGMMAEAQAYINLPRLAALTLVSVLLGLAIELGFSALSMLPYRKSRVAQND